MLDGIAENRGLKGTAAERPIARDVPSAATPLPPAAVVAPVAATRSLPSPSAETQAPAPPGANASAPPVLSARATVPARIMKPVSPAASAPPQPGSPERGTNGALILE